MGNSRYSNYHLNKSTCTGYIHFSSCNREFRPCASVISVASESPTPNSLSKLLGVKTWAGIFLDYCSSWLLFPDTHEALHFRIVNISSNFPHSQTIVLLPDGGNFHGKRTRPLPPGESMSHDNTDQWRPISSILAGGCGGPNEFSTVAQFSIFPHSGVSVAKGQNQPKCTNNDNGLDCNEKFHIDPPRFPQIPDWSTKKFVTPHMNTVPLYYWTTHH